ncbi:MAG TPA: ATP-binding protein [Thermodesulfobacteriota bacterium]|nr:ATP-binding protein [Thermodesulfobacteriota bacterium]
MTAKHVLIIDPDRDFAESTKKFLRSQGFRVSCASNGKQAIKKIAPESPLVALLCLELPDMKGQELLIRINEMAPHLAVLVTGHCKEKEISKLIDLGVIDFFPKPVNPSDLLKSIKNAASFFRPMRADLGTDEDSLIQKFFPFLIHELRNPLQAIGGAVSIIEKRSNLKDKPLSQSIRIIKEEVQYINGFIQNCLDFIRPSNKNFWIEFDLTELVSQCLKRLAYIFEDSIDGITINTYFEPSLPKVYANYEEIKEVVLNLLKNAVEAMDQSDIKALEIRVTHKGLTGSGWADIMIQDQGRGIRQDQVENLGTPFFTTKLRGTGLGLAICHKIIVERHKGKMMIESRENQGTTVTIKLPVRSAPRAT